MTLWQRWKQTALHNKLLVVIAALALIPSTAYVVTYIVQVVRDEMHRREERRPVVINNRPPKFLHPFTCDPKHGFQTRNIKIFVKNTGKTDAVHFFPKLWLHVTTEKKTGIPLYDNYFLNVNCSSASSAFSKLFDVTTAAPAGGSAARLRGGCGLP
jgi:hypothetical protein